MLDVDRPGQIQPFPEPAGARCPRVEAKALRVVASAESLEGITGHRSERGTSGSRLRMAASGRGRELGPVARDRRVGIEQAGFERPAAPPPMLLYGP